ncbi:MAG: DUF1653 domain-containing protein [Romboutsia sp.]
MKKYELIEVGIIEEKDIEAQLQSCKKLSGKESKKTYKKIINKIREIMNIDNFLCAQALGNGYIKVFIFDGMATDEVVNIVYDGNVHIEVEDMQERINEIKSWKGKMVRHFKGKEYIIVDFAKHTETGEELVIYKALYGDCNVYARPIGMFASKVDKEKYPKAEQDFRLEMIVK